MKQPPHPTPAPGFTPGDSASGRRQDLDALRAAAMLLGVAYHAALSFSLGSGWVVEDVRQSKALYLFQAFVHGFRMPLFMLLSGFFTAMLWRRHGLQALLRNRFKRVLLPCLAGLFTVVPATNWVTGWAKTSTAAREDAPTRLHTRTRDRFVRDGETRDSPAEHQVLSIHAAKREAQEAKDGAAGAFQPGRTRGDIWAKLTGTPVFSVLWFLWFLVWLLPLFGIYAWAAERLGWKGRSHPLTVTQGSLLWLVPVTAVPGWFMKAGGGEFGPDTSMGILPMPHVFLFYAVFFGFGVLYFECDGFGGRLGRAWRWSFPVSLLVVLPVALECAAGTFGLRETLLPAFWHRPVSVVFQALYAWTMAFAWMGMFRALPARAHGPVRYLSDASFWVYLAHLPLVILLQAAVRDWTLPALPKFLGICLGVTLSLLLGYDKLVRHTFLGRFLSGRRGQARPQGS